MVQVIENLTRLSGRLVTRGPHPRRPGWDLVVVHVEDTEPVAGRADLLSRHRGADLPVAFRGGLLADAGPDTRLTFRARFTVDGAMAEPHPDESDLVVELPWS